MFNNSYEFWSRHAVGARRRASLLRGGLEKAGLTTWTCLYDIGWRRLHNGRSGRLCDVRDLCRAMGQSGFHLEPRSTFFSK